jgi:hypothetical protein
MAATPLIIGASQKSALARLRAQAVAEPIDMPPVVKSLETEAGRAAHWQRMNALTIPIPLDFEVTFSIEHHPGGTMRHMSMSSGRRGRTPTPEAVWMICEELGFVGSIEHLPRLAGGHAGRRQGGECGAAGCGLTAA